MVQATRILWSVFLYILTTSKHIYLKKAESGAAALSVLIFSLIGTRRDIGEKKTEPSDFHNVGDDSDASFVSRRLHYFPCYQEALIKMTRETREKQLPLHPKLLTKLWQMWMSCLLYRKRQHSVALRILISFTVNARWVLEPCLRYRPLSYKWRSHGAFAASQAKALDLSEVVVQVHGQHLHGCRMLQPVCL